MKPQPQFDIEPLAFKPATVAEAWLGLLAAAIAVVLLWWAWWRWRNRPKPPVDPYARVQQEFARIEARHLLEDGQYADYFTAMVDVTREYLAARVPGVRRSDTTSELLRSMNPREGVEAVLPQLLDQADLVKFARAEVSLAEARGAGRDLRAIVDNVEARVNPESEVAKRMAAAKERAA